MTAPAFIELRFDLIFFVSESIASTLLRISSMASSGLDDTSHNLFNTDSRSLITEFVYESKVSQSDVDGFGGGGCKIIMGVSTILKTSLQYISYPNHLGRCHSPWMSDL